MEKVPYSKYTKELRLEAVRLVTEGGLSVGDASMRLSLPKSTLENWVRAFKAGKLERIGARCSSGRMSADKRATARELAHQHLSQNDPLGWF